MAGRGATAGRSIKPNSLERKQPQMAANLPRIQVKVNCD
jgi:hypothetical protein